MCGIILARNTKNQPKTGEDKKKKAKEPLETVNEFVINQYQNQFSRGTEGFGIILIDKDNKVTVKRATSEAKFLIDLYLFEESTIIAHHRKPTSSENKMLQTHPIYVQNEMLQYRYLVVHNGIISNSDDLKEKHEKMGFSYTTEYEKETYTNYVTTKYNDTESLAIELALFIEGKSSSIGVNGAAAFIAVQLEKIEDKARQIFYGRATNPLIMAKTRGRLRISSEGQGNDIKEDILYHFEMNDPDMKLKSKKIIFSRYEKPKLIPSKTEFATNHAESRGNGVLGLPFRGIVGKTMDSGPTDDDDEIIYEVDGKTHAKNCHCNTCWESPGETVSDIQNNLRSGIVLEYDDKFVDEYTKQFKTRLDGVEPEDIENEVDEQLNEIMDEMSKVIMGYKDDLLCSQPPEVNCNYVTILQQYMDAMNEIVRIGNEDFEEKEINAKADKEYEEAMYGRGYDGRDPYNEEDDPDLKGWSKVGGELSQGISRAAKKWQDQKHHREIMGFHQ